MVDAEYDYGGNGDGGDDVDDDGNADDDDVWLCVMIHDDVCRC